MSKIKTRWEKRDHFDVWGNEEDGYTVNNSMVDGEIEVEADLIVHAQGTEHEFTSAELSDDTIRDIFGIKPGIEIDVQGDDTHYEVETADDAYPIGSLTCVSHTSLSPIKENEG